MDGYVCVGVSLNMDTNINIHIYNLLNVHSHIKTDTYALVYDGG